MSGIPRRLLVLAGLLACLAAAAGCRDEKKTLIMLETQRDMILDRTRPKQAFWDQVGRKGEALKQEHAAAAELSATQAPIAQLQAQLAQARQQVDSARATNLKTSDVLSAQLAQLEQVRHSVFEHQVELAGFQARQRASGTP